MDYLSQLGIRVNGYVHLKTKNFCNLVRFSYARIGLYWHRAQIGQAVFNSLLKVQCSSLQQHCLCFLWGFTHGGNIKFWAERTIPLIFSDKDPGKGKHVHGCFPRENEISITTPV